MKLTKQELYDLQVLGAFDGSFPSVDKNGFCVYRGHGGMRCGIGICISDEEYSPIMDNGDEPGYKLNFLVKKAVPPPDGMSICDMADIQRCHDHSTFHTEENTNGWDREGFFRNLNMLSFFHDVIKVEGRSFSKKKQNVAQSNLEKW